MMRESAFAANETDERTIDNAADLGVGIRRRAPTRRAGEAEAGVASATATSLTARSGGETSAALCFGSCGASMCSHKISFLSAESLHHHDTATVAVQPAMHSMHSALNSAPAGLALLFVAWATCIPNSR